MQIPHAAYPANHLKSFKEVHATFLIPSLFNHSIIRSVDQYFGPGK